jgi:hypothetical protein
MDCIDHGSRQPAYLRTKRNGLNYWIHRVICAMTHNLPYDGDWVTRHTCDNPRCIRVEHLIPGTRNDNVQDAVARGQQASRTRHGMSKLTEEQVSAIRADTRTQQQIADDYCIHRGHVSKIKIGVSW